MGSRPVRAHSSSITGKGVQSQGRSGKVSPQNETNISSSGGGSNNADAELMDNGKRAEELPPADNDSILEAQIRSAAEAEKDPVVKARLIKRYREMKGL